MNEDLSAKDVEAMVSYNKAIDMLQRKEDSEKIVQYLEEIINSCSLPSLKSRCYLLILSTLRKEKVKNKDKLFNYIVKFFEIDAEKKGNLDYTMFSKGESYSESRKMVFQEFIIDLGGDEKQIFKLYDELPHWLRGFSLYLQDVKSGLYSGIIDVNKAFPILGIKEKLTKEIIREAFLKKLNEPFTEGILWLRTVAGDMGEYEILSILREKGASKEILERSKRLIEARDVLMKETKRKSCFIATAAYGSPFAPEIIFLQNFRDKVLQKSVFGRWFIAIYYRFSPPIADFISRFEFLKKMVRKILFPLIEAIKSFRKERS